MYNVHKFMALDNYQITYFIQQVGLAAESLGVSDADIGIVASALQSTFAHKCAAKAAVVPQAKEELQAICVAVSVSNANVEKSPADFGRMTVQWRQMLLAQLMIRSSSRCVQMERSMLVALRLHLEHIAQALQSRPVVPRRELACCLCRLCWRYCLVLSIWLDLSDKPVLCTMMCDDLVQELYFNTCSIIVFLSQWLMEYATHIRLSQEADLLPWSR